MSQKLIAAGSFAPAAWSGSGFGALEEMEVSIPFGRITTGLDQSSTAGFLSLDFNPGAKGTVGGPDDGPLIIDADDLTAGDPVNAGSIRNLSEVDLFVQAGGPAATIENIHCGHPRARNRLFSGNFDQCSISAGKQTASSSSVIEKWYSMGGVSDIAYKSDALTFLKLTGGVTTIRRKATTIIVGAGATLNLDPDSAATWTSASILILGGTVNWFGGAIPSIEAIGGVIDFRHARGAIGSGLGTTLFNLVGTKVLTNPIVDMSNASTPPAIRRSSEGLTEFSGGAIPFPG